MRLRLPELLAEHDMTAYQLAQRLEGRVSATTVYRLARGDVVQVPLYVLDALCDVFTLDPGPLFHREAPKAPRRRR
jgi:DNA-binding Xre family transcriptional regulator